MAAKAQPRPGVPEDAYQLGLRLAERGDLIGAEAALRRAHEQGHPEAVHSLGRLLADSADAMAAKPPSAADERGDPDAAFDLGIQLWDRGNLDGAEAAFRRADERGHAGAAFHLGMLLEEQR